MATQFSTLLKIALPTQGELSGSWGNTVNDSITKLVEEAIAGTATINTWSTNSATLSTANGATAESRNAILNLTDTGTSLSGAATVIVPTLSKIFVVKNGTAQTVTVKTASGTGVDVTAGETCFVFCDGTNVVEALDRIAGNFNVGGNLTVDGNATITGTTTLNGGTLTLGDAASDNVVFGADVDSSIIPDDDNTFDLGSSSQQWRDIYINGSAYIDGLAEDILVATDKKVLFRDSAIFINSSADGQLDIDADTEVEITTTTVDLNGNLDVSGTSTLTGNVTLGAQLRMPDNTAHKILVADGTSFEEKALGDLNEISTVANDDVFLAVDTSGGGLKRITRSTIVSGLATSSGISNIVEDSSPQLGGDLDMNGNDIVTTSNATIDLAPNGTGTVVVRGNTNSGRIVFNCESNSHGQTLASQPHSASVTNVMLLPAGADSTLVSLVSTDTLQNKTLTSPVLNTPTVGTSIAPASADGATLGTAAAEFSDLFLADGGTIQFGNDQEITLTHVADSGLTLKHASTSDDKFPTLTLAAGDNDIASADKLGVINFIAPDEGAGTDAILVAAGIEAVSEGDFSASNNATKLSFKTAASAAAAETMSLSSTGLLTIADDLVIKDGGTIGVASDADSITIASDGQLTLTQQLNGTAGDFSGDVAAANFQPDGDTSAGDAAAVGFTSAEGLILTGQGSSNDVTIKNDADAEVIGIPTGTTNVNIVGVATAATFEPDGDTAAGDNAAIGFTSSEGLILTGQGSSTDVTIKNDADATVASIATGTTIFKMNDDVEVDGRAFGHVTTDNDGSFDLSVGNDFQCTPSGNFTLTFTNAEAGQSGNILLINSGGHTVSAHADVAINATALTALATAGTYHLAYFVSAASGNNTIAVSASGALT